jgi:hypothetical protein
VPFDLRYVLVLVNHKRIFECGRQRSLKLREWFLLLKIQTLLISIIEAFNQEKDRDR